MRSTDATASWTHPSRHARVWLDAATWRSRLRNDVDPSIVPFIGDWIARGRPLVARRRDEAASDDCFVGLASSPAQGRLRIPLVVDRAAVVRIAPPLVLRDVLATAPDDRRAALESLEREADAVGVSFSVYGSFAWQALSGDRYVTPTSDLDLLWDASDRVRIADVVALLTRWEAASGLRADGEARFPNGDAVAWRELATAHGTVLVKRDDGVSVAPSPIVAHG